MYLTRLKNKSEKKLKDLLHNCRIICMSGHGVRKGLVRWFGIHLPVNELACLNGNVLLKSASEVQVPM